MNRGSIVIGGYGHGALPCFNEAPIHESGKYGLGAWPRPRARRFNEAPIHESGKC